MMTISQLCESVKAYSKKPRIVYAALFCWNTFTGGRFTAPFLKEEIGFDDSLIGLALALQSGLGAMTGPWGGSIADRRQRTHKHGRVHVLCIGLAIVSIAVLFHGIAYLIPSFSLKKTPSSYIRTCIISWHIFLRLVIACGQSVIMPVIDGLTLAYLESHPDLDRTEYGKERLHGAIWWAIANAILGPILDIFGFKALYFTDIIVLGLSFIAIFSYTKSIDDEEVASQKEQLGQPEVSLVNRKKNVHDIKSKNQNEKKDERSSWYFIKIIAGTLYGATFLLSFFCVKTGMSVGSNTISGLTVGVTVIFEIPIFHYAPLILRKIGPGLMQQIACMAYVIRVVGYSLIPQNHIAWVLLLEPLHGITYGFSKTSGVEFVAKFMPTGYEAQGQGIISMFSSIGSFVGLLLGGWAEQTFGPRAMYRGFAAIVFLAVVQFSIAQKFHDYTQKSNANSFDKGVGEDTKLITSSHNDDNHTLV